MNNTEDTFLDAPKLVFVKTHPDAQLPKKNHDTDAGYDIFAVEDTLIPANCAVVVPVGLKVGYIEPGYFVKVESRSGLSFKNRILAHPGIIDEEYRGDLGTLLYNHGTQDYQVKKGDKIAQLVVYFNIKMTTEFGEAVDSVRGEKGFGSSGR